MALKPDSDRIKRIFGVASRGKIEKIKIDRGLFAGRFFRNRAGEVWTPRDYQVESLSSRAWRKVHCDGRDVGKTSEIEIVALYTALLCPQTEILIAAPCANHLIPTMERIISRLKDIEEFKGTVKQITRSLSYRIVLDTPALIWGKIAGPRGINFQNTHVDLMLVDEAQAMPDAAWEELFPALNARGWRWIYGVPNGIRNMFYRMTEMADCVQYHWPSKLNPDFNEEKDRELQKLYGGVDAPGYIHNVLGEHGKPAYGVFDPQAYDSCLDRQALFYDIRLTGAILSGGSLDVHLPKREDFPAGRFYLGCDLGYTADPSEFTGWCYMDDRFRSIFRINLANVRYDVQQDLIIRLHDRFGFSGIGLDKGGNGAAVMHNLLAARPELECVLEGYQFGEKIEVGFGREGQENKMPIKQFMTELLIKAMEGERLILADCPDREHEYLSHTYHLGANDLVIYDKGHDHIIDADRCAILRWHRQENPLVSARVYRPGLIRGLQNPGGGVLPV